MNVDALTAQGRIDEARHVLLSAVDRTPDQALYARAAAFEDRYGTGAPRYFKSLVESMRAEGQPETAWHPAAERGMYASIRERQTETCQWFAALLASNLCTPDVSANPDASGVVLLPGGLRALMYMAGGAPRSNASPSLAELSRVLTASQAGRDLFTAESYRRNLIEYFRLLAELKTLGHAENDRTRLRLSFADPGSRATTEHALNLLGWNARMEGGATVVELATGSPWARHADLASAFGIDVAAMQDILQSGQDFTFDIVDERVRIFPAENYWQSQFYPVGYYTGGFAEAMVHDPSMASLYTALSDMEPAAADFLVQTIGMRTLAERYVRLLNLYGSSLDFSGGRLELPGGDAAAPGWAALAGLPAEEKMQQDPRRFLRALLDKDEGRLLHFYFILSQLDSKRQRFFTTDQKPTKEFYSAFRQSSQVAARLARDVNAPSIEDLFRELPLDSEGRILFPGSAGVWMHAKSQVSSVRNTSLPAVSRPETPAVDDEILLRLLRSEYTHQGTLLAEWQTFLAVVRIGAARPQPLDDDSALLLAENYAAHRSVYSYFSSLTALDASQFREVLRLDEKIHELDHSKGNIADGLLQSALYVLSSAEKSGRIPPRPAATLLTKFATSINRSSASAQWSRASLSLIGGYLAAAGADSNSASLCDILLPASAFKSCSRVLELQNVPPLGDLLKLQTALTTLDSMQGDARAAVNEVTLVTRRLTEVDAHATLKLPDPDHEATEPNEAYLFSSLAAAMQKELGIGKTAPKRLQKLANDYWDALEFPTMLSLAGQVYAANFRPDDLLVADDPMFIRKHRFVASDPAAHEPFAAGQLDIQNYAGGTRILGGFSGISTVAGQAAAGSLRGLDAMSGFVASALLGSVRATDWARIDQSSLRSVAVQIHAAQDWLILAATDPSVNEAVKTATQGLVSYNRRARLMTALQHRDWKSVWKTLSLTDLYLLGDRMRTLTDKTGLSPSIAEYKASVPVPIALPNFEAATYEMAATAHPAHLAQRLAEFNLYLVRLFAEQSLPAGDLPSAAESATRAVLSDIRMSGVNDWQSVLDAYEAFDSARLRQLLGTL